MIYCKSPEHYDILIPDGQFTHHVSNVVGACTLQFRQPFANIISVCDFISVSDAGCLWAQASLSHLVHLC